jgi:hypothetical protein
MRKSQKKSQHHHATLKTPNLTTYQRQLRQQFGAPYTHRTAHASHRTRIAPYTHRTAHASHRTCIAPYTNHAVQAVVSGSGISPIYVASREGEWQLRIFQVSHVNGPPHGAYLRTSGCRTWTLTAVLVARGLALRLMATGHSAIVEMLLDAHVSPSTARFDNGALPIHAAVG